MPVSNTLSLEVLKIAAEYGLELDEVELLVTPGTNNILHCCVGDCNRTPLTVHKASEVVNMTMCGGCAAHLTDSKGRSFRETYGSSYFDGLLSGMHRFFSCTSPDSAGANARKKFFNMCRAKDRLADYAAECVNVDTTSMLKFADVIFEQALINWKPVLESSAAFKTIEDISLREFVPYLAMPPIFGGIADDYEVRIQETRDAIRNSGVWVLTDFNFGFERGSLLRCLYPTRVVGTRLFNVPFYLTKPMSEYNYVQTDGPLSDEIFEIVSTLTADSSKDLKEALELALNV